MDPDLPDLTHVRTFEKMISYLEGDLPAQEIQEMEKLLSMDNQFATQMDELQEAWMRNPNLKEEVPEFHQKMISRFKELADDGGSQNSQRSFKNKIRMAAALAAVIAIFFILRSITGDGAPCQFENLLSWVTEEGIYKQKYTTMSQGPPSSITQTFDVYDQSRYQEAIPPFEQAIDTTLTTTVMREMTMCLGVSYVMTNQPKAALPYLYRAQKFAEPRYTKESHWYLAIANLQLENTLKAKALLRQVVADESHYAEGARKLLDCLD